jgi:PEP-CTERM motif
MSRSKLLFACALIGILALMSGPAWADDIPLQNASFETTNPLNLPFSGGPFNLGPIPSWNTSGVAGSWQPNSSMFSSIPDGSIVAYTNNGSISQTLTGTSVLANTFYTLSVFVGNRLDGFSGNYTIALDAGATPLCTFSGNSSSITAGTFAQETCSFESGSVVPAGDLSVVFSSAQGTQVTQLDVDKVSVSTPEPSALALMTIGLSFLFLTLRRKVQIPLSA